MTATEVISAQVGESGRYIVFILTPERSAFNASFVLARGLRDKGYRVLYIGPDRCRQHVVNQGFEYEVFEYARHPEEPELRDGIPVTEIDFSGIRGWWRMRSFVAFERWAEFELRGRTLKRFHQLNPLVALLDPLVWAYARLPLECGVPLISFNTSLASSFNWHVPPAFCNLLPVEPETLASRLRNGLAWSRMTLKYWLLYTLLPPLFSLRLLLWPRGSLFRPLRRLGARICWSEYGPRLKLPELVAAPSAFDFPQMLSSNDRTYLGTCVDQQRQDVEFDWQGIDEQKPLVYCSLGTYSHVYDHGQRLFRAVVELACKRPEYQFVVQIGTAMEVTDFNEVPDNVRLLKEVPQLLLLQRTRFFITHGGLSSVREAIMFAVPMMVLPCWMEQPGNAARVVYHGLGVRGDIAQIDALGLARLLEGLEQGDWQGNLQRMQAAFQREEGPQAGIDFIESFLRKRSNGQEQTSQLVPDNALGA
ncbi:nucleotide disphospho-sugar-binding domain-containing protein [Pseudomonas sp. LRF_L74]|uniref:nucleotide disphospho-sugar-binding domain-containing protein n=1 Tax=Pseudomonas sp. LRF_L74 TaxID=3369422 RepID=UPI003F5D6A11